MNRIYRVLWSKVRNAWVVASELATGHGKGGTATVSVSRTRVERHDYRVSTRAWPLRMAILATLLTLQAPARAADRYWDANRTDPGLGGTGAWDLTNTFWDSQGDGVTGPYVSWNNAVLDDAFFNSVAGTITLGLPITVHNLTFGLNGFTLDGGTLTLAGTSPTINTLAGNATINSVVVGTAGLTKAGGGGLFLNGINTFVGDIDLALGSLYAASDAALGAAGNNINTGAGAVVRLSIGGASNTSRTVTIGDGGTVSLEGAAGGSALVTGNGNIRVGSSVTMSNDDNTYTGTTTFYGCNGVCSSYFTSIADLNMPSSLGAPTTAGNGTIHFDQSSQYSDNLIYLGDGDSSNRNWSITGGVAVIRNRGSGTLTLTGDIANAGGTQFLAEYADLELLGEISGTASLTLSGTAGRTITLGGANTYTRATGITNVTVFAPVLADRGVASSFGTAESYISGTETIEPAIQMTNGALSYTGPDAASDRNWTSQGATAIRNDGTGALTLSGPLSFVAGGAIDTLALGGSYAGADNAFSGAISGDGAVVVDGDGTWVLSGVNTYTGSTTVQSGTLRAGGAEAFGTTGAATVNGGTLDLADLDTTFTTLSGSGGVVALGSGTLTLNAAADGDTDYAGNITGTGGLTKLGASTQTLSGANTYSGATTLGGGTLGVNFAAAGGPTSDIISSLSTLNMAGGTLSVTGAAGENNTQAFNGLNITGGTNNVSVTSGAGGTVALDLGAISRAGGLIDFDLPANGFIATSSTSLGGWATINNGATYAKIVGGHISAFDENDYIVQDDPSLWQDGQFITDDAGFTTNAVDSPDGTLQLGGLRYTAARATTLNIAGGDTLGIDGNILVAPSVAGFNQRIAGGSLTGPLGGGMLGIQQNSTGTFTIDSQIVDNGGGAVGFTKAGTGEVVLADANNTYTGPTVVSQGTLTVDNIANGGVASSIGASSADPANLVIEAGTLQYTGASATTDRGFTIVRGGPEASELHVSSSAANLTFTGLVTSPDDADFTKTGAGTLTLANAANDYTGITTVMGGTLSVGTLANGGMVSGIGRSTSSSANLVLYSGTLQYTGGTVTSDRGFTLDGVGGGGIDVTDVNTALTFSGTVVGAADLRKEGAGTLVLAGTNAYTGSTTINGGILRAGSENAFGGPARMNLADAAGVTLDLAGFDNKIGGLSGGGANGGNVLLGDATLTLGGSNVSFSGSISGIGGLYKENSSTQTMVGCNHTYTGATTIFAGTLSVSCLADGGDASGIGASTSDAANLVIRGTLDYTGDSVSIDRGFEAASGVVNVANSATTLELRGDVTGAQFTKNGPGTLVLSGNNTNSGATFVSGGILRAGSETAFGASGIRMDVSGATLDLAGLDNTVVYLHETAAAAGDTTRNVLLGGATLTINGNNGIFSGVISGNGSLVKSVGGTQTLNGCGNSYTGPTSITGGALAVSCLTDGGINSSIGNSSADPDNLYIGATFSYIGAGSTTNRQFTVGAGGATLTASGTGAVNFTSTAPIALEGSNARTLTLRGTNTDDNTLAVQITDASAGVTRLTKTDAGTWMLTNANNTYTGVTTINGGVLSVSKLADGGQQSSIGTSSNAASNVVIGNGSTLRYTGAGDTTDRLFTLSQGVTYIESSGTGAIQFTNTAPVTLSGTAMRTIALGGTNTGNNTMGGTIADASASGKTTLAKNDSGTWVLTGDNTYTGNTVINDGNLVIGNGGTTGNAGAGNVIVDSATSTLSINRGDAFDFNGTLSGPGSLAQIGAGTTHLTAADNSIGATTVSAGTLQVDAGGGLTTTTVAMNGTSTLNVEGTVQGAPGVAATFTGDGGASTININTGGTLFASGDLGDGSDVMNVTGTLETGATTLSLGDGDDTFTLNDGAVINGDGVDAGGAATADTLQVNNAIDRTFDGVGFSGFEQLVKQNTGVLTLTGTQSFSAGTDVAAGSLDVDGTLETAAVTLADDTTLNIDGGVQSTDGSPTTITGSAGVNTVLVNAGATLNETGDLGDGSDVVTVAGTLDTGAGVLSLGAGDDTFTLTDGAVISGTVDGGAATTGDVLVLDNAAALTFDGNMTGGFEQLIKQNTGVATMVGAQAFVDGAAIDSGVLVINGTLQTPSIAMADDTTLQVDGAVYVPGPLPTEITGSAGVNTILVSAPSQLFATGDLGAGSDVLFLSGRLETGAGILSLGDDDDTLILGDTAEIVGSGVDASTGANDELVLANQFALTFDGATTAGFEQLTKQNTGVATMTGTQSFVGTTISGGTLDIDGTLETATVDLADDTTLNVDGTVQAAGSTQTTITGSAGVNTVSVSEGASLLAIGDLGDGNDVLDIAGTLDIGAGVLSLGDGDDVFVVHDGTNVVGTVDGGAGLDTRAYDISLTADVGALLGFEGLTKTGTGTLNINGPGTTSLEEVEVLGGTLNVAAGGAIADVQSTTVGSGATMNVDGTYAGSSGNDTFTVAGTVSGAGSVDLGTGDDVLTLQDGAAVNITIDAGGETAGDSVVLDNASALTFDGANVTGFEELVKQNTGTATLAGTHIYDSVAIDGGILDVDGTLQSATISLADGTTLDIDGTVQAAGGTQSVVTGTAGVNTVVVNAGGSLLASGDLGDGNDVLDVAGTLDTGGGVFSLGAGDDTFVVHNTTQVIGTLDGGAGNDLLNVNVDSGSLVPLGSTTGFESLGKSGLGTLAINGASDFVDVQVQAGLLDIDAGGSIAAQTVDVSAGATLSVDGALDFTAGADAFTVAGTVSGAGTIDMLDGDDQLTILDGADLSGLGTSLEGGAGNDTLTADIATSATLGGVTGFETLNKDGVGTFNIDGPASSSFETVNVQDGVLGVAASANVAGVTATTVASGATLNVDGSYAGSAGNDTFTLAGTVSGAGTIDLGTGDDVFTIRDGATLGLAIDAGGETVGDRVVLDNAAAFTLDRTSISGFEQLAKQNAGTATLTGAHAYDSVAIDGGTLDVDQSLETASATLADGATLNVDGAMQAVGGGQVALTGSAGVNTVVVSAGATLAATGDLGDGSDVLDVGGTLDAGGGAFNLGAGDDTFVIRDGTSVIGTVDGGAGLDTRVYDIAGTANVGALQEFEGLTKRNTGTLNINGPGATTDLIEVAVEGGVLNVAAAGSVVGVQATTVSSGATLNVDGAYAGGTGNDTFTLAGTVSGAGSIDLGDDDDVLTLQDGAVLSAAIDGGNGVVGDRVVLDNASDLMFDAANVAGFEDLVKQNTGAAALVGAHSYDSTTIDGGTLDVDGTLETSAVTLADGTTLNVYGTVQAVGATQATITGSTGINSVQVSAGSTLLATGDLGEGNDVLDVAGTFDTGGGTFFLGAGDDTFVVHDNTVVNGAIDGGDGLDTRVYDINLSADLGALTNFEGLTKTGAGVLHIHGPGSSDLDEVEVLGGTLNIANTGGIIGVTSATVGTGATLSVDGVFEFTAGGDAFDVAGAITGLASIDMLDGDDQLTLRDGADLSGLTSPLDGGAGNDLLIANIATAATLGGVSGFENLTKQGAGVLNVAPPASSSFDTVLVEAGSLDVASGASIAAHTASVEQGATLNVDGDFLFTAGGDTFTVAGAVTGPGSVDMLDGDDQLTLRDGADLSGLATSLDGGDGSDTLTADIATQAVLGGATGFETLVKEGVGLVTIAGPAESMFDTVLVHEGELNVAAGAVVDPQTTVVDAGATMTIDGAYNGTADADTFTLSGTLAGSGMVDLLEGDDVLTINTGADVTFTGVFDASTQAAADRFVLAGGGEDALDASLIGTVFQNFEEFSKEGAGTWRLTGTGSNDWSVAEGTLIGDSQSFGGNLDNAATVVFDQATDGSYDHVLSGDGTFIKRNAGTLAMGGTHTFSGDTQIKAGTLQVDGVLPGTVTVNSGATLSGTGTVGGVSALAGGFVAPGTAALPFGTLTVAGDYAGDGAVRINTVLGNEDSDTGRLVVQGNVSGTSNVLVNRWSGNGARTQGDGIGIIQVDGTSTPDSFQLGQPVEAGAYQYLLYQGGSEDTNDWYLRSELIDPNNPPDGEEPPTPAFRAGVPGYVLGHQANLEYGYTALGNLRARVGDQGRVPGAEQGPSPDAWMRVYAHEFDVSGTRFAAQDLQMTTVQFGTDIYAHSSGKASTHFGVMASVGESRATLFDTARAIGGFSTLAGEMETDAKGAGLYWTHFGAGGGYFDLSGQLLHYSNRYRDQSLADADQRGWGGTVAAEIGAVYALGKTGWLIEPQVQFGYQRLELDGFKDDVSNVGSVEDDGLRARAAVQLLRAPANWLGMSDASPYIGLGAQRDFRDASAVTIGGTTLNDEIPDTTGDVSVGFTGSVRSGVELHLDVRYQKSTEGEKDGMRANFGFRMSF